MIKKISILGLASAVTLLTAGSAFAAVATGGVNVRTGPSTGYPILDTLSPGEHVNVNDQNGGWCHVSKPGPDGWVSRTYLTSDAGNGYTQGYDQGYSRGYDDGTFDGGGYYEGDGAPFYGPDRYDHPRPDYGPFGWFDDGY